MHKNMIYLMDHRQNVGLHHRKDTEGFCCIFVDFINNCNLNKILSYLIEQNLYNLSGLLCINFLQTLIGNSRLDKRYILACIGL